MNIGALRNEYTKAVLEINSVDHSPFRQFKKWFNEAIAAELLEPSAMILSTVDQNHCPSQRTVLLKAFDKNGFVFFTNYSSKKALQIQNNANVSIHFPWYGLERQVMISGQAKKISTKKSIEYFMSRPFNSQLSAWVSHQSKVISSRSILEIKFAEMKKKFQEGKVPLPDFWGGFLIKPSSFEFWQGRANRLHDRIYYEYVDENWEISRLSP